MNLIHLNNFTIRYDVDNPTTYRKDQWSVIDSSIELYTDEIIEDELVRTYLYPKKYIESLIIEGTETYNNTIYPKVTSINLMSIEDQAIVDKQLSDNATKVSFKNHRLRLSGDSKKARAELTGLITESIARNDISIWSSKEIIYHPILTDKILSTNNTIYVGLDYITQTDYDSLSLIPGLVFETYNGNPITNVLPDDSLEFIIPQVDEM